MVEEHCSAEAIDDLGVAVNAEEVGNGAIRVADIGRALRDARTRVFRDAATARNAVQRIAASGVDV